MSSICIILFMAIVMCTLGCCVAKQPPYQVSLYVQLHPRSSPVHLCNGIIVQSRLILTTASCLHYRFSASGDDDTVIAIAPYMMSVVSGSATPFSDELKTQVAATFVAEGFNYTTGANDVALLRLSDKLPLDTRNDISWIILDEPDNFAGPCLANFYIRDSQDGASNYIQSEHLPLLHYQECTFVSKFFLQRKSDICSYYYFPTGFNCNALEGMHHYNSDRGTGLLCENMLVGILSTILPLQNEPDCSERPIQAYYTSLAPHLLWIFDVIANEDTIDLNEGTYISSLPYAGETNAFVQPALTEPSSTWPTIEVVLTTSVVTIGQHSAAAHAVQNFRIVSLIFGFYFIIKM